jgi:DNA repair protein RadC
LLSQEAEKSNNRGAGKMHDGHRERIKKRFKETGLAGFPDHNILELLLFYTIPRRDTNELAHLLINTFGSLSAVFDASFEELIKVGGVGENTASLIKLMPQIYGKYLEDKLSVSTVIDSTDAAGEYFVAKYIGVVNERAMLMCLDSKCCIKNCETLSDGSTTMTEITGRKVVENALKNNAVSVILAHNHPHGIAVPSPEDVDLTRTIIRLLNSIDIKLRDHIIVANNEYFSMADTKKFSIMFL